MRDQHRNGRCRDQLLLNDRDGQRSKRASNQVVDNRCRQQLTPAEPMDSASRVGHPAETAVQAKLSAPAVGDKLSHLVSAPVVHLGGHEFARVPTDHADGRRRRGV
jgi:hypothetical protein